MASRNRSNPLALAVLICLYERPMHPYEVATTLRQRNKHESVRLNYGSLYAVVASLERRGHITPLETAREGRLPERTVYELTDAGRVEMHDWLTDLIATPVKEYPSFEAALSFLPALPPDDVIGLLRERALRLETEIAQAQASEDVAEKMGLPRLFSIEGQFRRVLLEAELDFARRLAADIESGALDGVDWWRAVHRGGADPPQLPPFTDQLSETTTRSPMTLTTHAICAEELSKTFPSRRGPVEAVRGVDLQVESGEIFGLLGPNGAGKTTTMRMLTTLLPIGGGSATVAGFDVTQQPRKVRENIGYVSQLGGADELATGRENLVLQGRLYGASLSEVRPRVDRAGRHPGPLGLHRPAGEDVLGRPATASRRGAGHRPPTKGPLPRRADHRARPAEPGQSVGPPACPAGQGHHHRAHHALSRRSRRPLRPCDDRRPWPGRHLRNTA